MTRDKALLKLRLNIPTDDNLRTTPLEYFQNNTLRPILKFQNELYIKLLLSSNSIVKIPFDRKTEFDKKGIITKIMKQDQKLKELIIGATISLMTSEELESFYNNKSEFQRRITSMVTERLIDQVVK